MIITNDNNNKFNLKNQNDLKISPCFPDES